MRYTLAAFAIMASAVLASPVPLDTTTNEIAARDTANTDVMNWGPFGGPPGFSSYTDWSTRGWPDYATWKQWAQANLPWQGYRSFDDWWLQNGYAYWKQLTGDTTTQYSNSDFVTWFQQDGYKTFDPRLVYRTSGINGLSSLNTINGDWFQDSDGVGYHRVNGQWVRDDDGFDSWGTSDVVLNDDDDWFQDSTGQGWHKVKTSDVWVKDDPSYVTPTVKKVAVADPGYKTTPTPTPSSYDTWTKGSNGKWSKGTF